MKSNYLCNVLRLFGREQGCDTPRTPLIGGESVSGFVCVEFTFVMRKDKINGAHHGPGPHLLPPRRSVRGVFTHTHRY